MWAANVKSGVSWSHCLVFTRFPLSSFYLWRSGRNPCKTKATFCNEGNIDIPFWGYRVLEVAHMVYIYIYILCPHQLLYMILIYRYIYIYMLYIYMLYIYVCMLYIIYIYIYIYIHNSCSWLKTPKDLELRPWGANKFRGPLYWAAAPVALWWCGNFRVPNRRKQTQIVKGGWNKMSG